MQDEASAQAPLPSYPDAPESLFEHWSLRRKMLRPGPDEAFPPLDPDFAALKEQIVSAPEPLPQGASAHAVKQAEIHREFAGSPAILALNALLIAHLRKRRWPEGTPQMFQRLWAEEGPYLIDHLPPRWLISSAITFGDHGVTEDQRRIGWSMNMLFSLMKLYEFERLSSGRDGTTPFERKKPADRRLPLDMPPFSLKTGGLDVNLLAPLWYQCRRDPVAGPLADKLLTLLNQDSHGLFRRLSTLRARKRAGPPPGA